MCISRRGSCPCSEVLPQVLSDLHPQGLEQFGWGLGDTRLVAGAVLGEMQPPAAGLQAGRALLEQPR